MSNFVASITLQFKDAFSKGIQRAVGGAKSTVKGLVNTVGSMSNGSQFLQTAANLLLVSGHVSGMARSVSGAVNTWSTAAAGFEGSMAAVRSSLVMSVGPGKAMETQFHNLRTAAQAWSSANADSASEYAQTSYMMLSAGLNTEAAIQGTNAALSLAKATMGDATEAGNLLATAYNNMKRDGESAEDGMSRLSDVIAKTQSMFQIANLSQLGEGLKYAVAAAKPAGMQMEQLSTIIGALNTAGLQGSQAGTAFAASLRNIDKAGKKLGFDVVYDTAGGLDFIHTLDNIQQKFGDVETRTVAQRQALQAAFGDEGVRAINLLGADVEGLARSFEAVRDAQGASAAMAGEMADTYAEKLKTAENAVANFKARLGAGTNSVRIFGAHMTAGLAHFGSWAAELPVLGGTLAGIAGGAMEVGGNLLSLGSAGLSAGTGILSFMMIAEKIGGVSKLTGIIKGTMSGILGLGKSFILGIPALIGWAGAMWAAAAAHIAAFWPVYAIIGGIAALGAGIVLLVKHWRAIVGVITGAVVGAFTFLKNILVSLWQWFGKIAENPLIAAAGVLFAPFIAIPSLIFKHWEPIKSFFTSLFGTVGTVIGAVGSFLGFGEKKDGIVATTSHRTGMPFGGARTTGGTITSTRTGLPYGGGRALGGAVSPGFVYTVGERGVEHFVPAVAGTVVPNRDLRTRGASPTSTGQQPMNVYIETVCMDAPRDVQQMFDFFTRLKEEFGVR